MKLTKEKVLYYNIMKWQYFYDHPSQYFLPFKGEYKIIHSFGGECAQCEYVHRYLHKECSVCYLFKNDICNNFTIGDTSFAKWKKAKTAKTRKKYAGIILEACKKMTVKDL